MSGVIVLVQRDRASLFADSAVYDTETGVIVRLESKVAAWNQPPIAIVSTGSTAAVAPGLQLEGETFEEVVRSMPGALRERLESMPHRRPQAEIVAVGYSQLNGRFEAWGVSNGDPGELQGVCGAEGYKPFAPMRLPDTWGVPYLNPDAAPEFVAKWSGVPLERIEPEAFGVDALQAARLSGHDPARQQAVWVGGFIEVAQVTRSGAIVKPLARWPDKIGAVADPAAPLLPVITEEQVRALFLNQLH